MDESVFVLIPIVSVISGTLLVIGAIWLGVRARTRRMELMTELQNKVLDKFGSSAEFVEFVRTPEGRHWMTASTEGKSRQADKVLASLRWGLITGCFGGAFLILAAIREPDLVYPGFLIGSVGVGFLVHVVITWKLGEIRSVVERFAIAEILPGGAAATAVLVAALGSLVALTVFAVAVHSLLAEL